jgi:hypothetical protein
MLLLFESLLGISWSVWILIAFVFSLLIFIAIVFIHRRNNRIKFVQLEHKIYEHADTVHKQLEYKVFRLQKLIEDLPVKVNIPPTIASEEASERAYSEPTAGKSEEIAHKRITEELESIRMQVQQFRSELYAGNQHQESFKKGIHQLFSELSERLYTNEKHLNRFINMLDELAQEHGLELMDPEEAGEEVAEKGTSPSKPNYFDFTPIYPLAGSEAELPAEEAEPEREPATEAVEEQPHGETTEETSLEAEPAAAEFISSEPEPEPEDVLSDATIEEHSEPEGEIMDNAISDSVQTEEPAPPEDEPTEEASESAEPEAASETDSSAENESDKYIVHSEEEIPEVDYETAEPADAPETSSAAEVEPDNFTVPLQDEVVETASTTTEIVEVTEQAVTNENAAVASVKTEETTDEIYYSGSVEEGVFYFEKPDAEGCFNQQDAGTRRSNLSLYKLIIDPVSGDMASCVLLTDNAARTAQAIENPEELLRPVCDIQSLKGSGSRLTLLQKGVLHKEGQMWQIRADSRLKVLLF